MAAWWCGWLQLLIWLAFFDEFDGICLPRRFHDALNDGTLGNGYGIAADGTDDLRGGGYFYLASRDDIPFDMAGDDDGACLDQAPPKAVAGQGDGTVDVAVAFYFTTDQEIAAADDHACNLAAFID